MTNNLFPVVILAGGLGTRLGDLTKESPKSMVLIKGEPFIAHQLRLLKRQGVKKVIICIGHMGNQISDYVEEGQSFGLDVTYSSDGTTLRGTAGAIINALPILSESFFVIYGDSYLRCSFQDIQTFYINKQKLALMSIYRNSNNGDISNILYSPPNKIQYNKMKPNSLMQHIDFGLGIFNRSIFENLMIKDNLDLSDLYQQLINNDSLAVYEVFQSFYEVGSLNGINELSAYLDSAKT